MLTVNMLEAETNLCRLVESVESGAETEIVIARDGRPVARLVPVVAKPDASKRLGIMQGEIPDMSLEEFNALDAEVAKLFLGEG